MLARATTMLFDGRRKMDLEPGPYEGGSESLAATLTDIESCCKDLRNLSTA